MRKFLFFFGLFVVLSSYVHSSNLHGLGVPEAILKKIKPIFKEAQKNNWDKAKKMAEKEGPVTRATLDWYYLMGENNKPSFADYKNFLFNHIKWPDHRKLAGWGEEALIKEAKEIAPSLILKWFAEYPPKSKAAKLLKLSLTTDKAQQDSLILALWTSYDFGAKDEREFLKKYKKRIPAWAHMAKARKLMDHGNVKALARIVPLLNKDQQKLYRIRQQIAHADKSIRHLRRMVPKSMMTDPGYLMQVLRWYHKRDHTDLAEVILLEYKPTHEYRKDWENIRRIQAREVMKLRRYRAAHDIAHRHSHSSGADAADMEWFSGWIALEYLNNTHHALKHFNKFLRLVGTNLSLSRAYYWLGRTYEKIKDKKKAIYYYTKASQYGWTFYGQLASTRAKVKLNMTPIKTKPIPAGKTRLLQAAHIMSAMDEKKLARKLLQQGAARLGSAGELLTLSYFAKKLGITENIVRFARGAQNKAPGLALEAYPKLRAVFQAKEVKKGLDPALVHAVILQESRFDEDVVSFDAGHGYMQLMSYTAKRMAKLAKVPYNKRKLLQGDYNILMGTTYLQLLLKLFDGYYPFAAPSYNAGEDRVEKWHEEFGNPAKNQKLDIINWSESLTYVVTRGYIQRIMENVHVYRHILKLKPKHMKPWWKNWNLAAKT